MSSITTLWDNCSILDKSSPFVLTNRRSIAASISIRLILSLNLYNLYFGIFCFMLFIKSVTNIVKKFLLVNNITLYLTLYQGIEIINFSNLPNNSFTSIFAVFPSHRGVVTLQVQRCLQGLDGRTRSSLAVL